MKVLLIGSGGREHALAWKISQSPLLTKLWIAPGNAGTARLGENVPIAAENATALVNFAYKSNADLVIIGPEAPLAAGLADDLRSMRMKVFGPSRSASQIEASKSYAKAFMERYNIPTPQYAIFTDFDEALDYLHLWEKPVPPVLKASGLAAGKGVIVPNTMAEAESGLRYLMVNREVGAAGNEVIIEEQLVGEEVSLLAFTDGTTLRPLPPAQDHKRLLEGDRGPNTGGMGAIAPTPLCSPSLMEECVHRILQPAVDGLRSEGRPFVGVLYAGLMLTKEGPKVLEFNSRFGDPETQAILPLMESDLLEVAQACVAGRLKDVAIRWKKAAAACIVLTSEGYPSRAATGRPVSGRLVDEPTPDQIQALVFHAGTRLLGDKVVTAGGRVLGVTGLGANLKEALERAYAAVEHINFEGMHYRRDIAKRLVEKLYGNG